MSFPGFVPVRQLVLVDLLSLILSVRPRERAMVAIDGVDGPSRAHLTRELLALAEHVAGRQVVCVAMDDFRHQAFSAPVERSEGQASYLSGFDYHAFTVAVVDPFRAGIDIADRAAGPEQPAPIIEGLSERAPQQIDEDAVLLVDGTFLHRPELVSGWDASVFVRSNGDATDALSVYLDQSPDLQATWVLDNTAPAAPLLTFGATVEPTA